MLLSKIKNQISYYFGQRLLIAIYLCRNFSLFLFSTFVLASCARSESKIESKISFGNVFSVDNKESSRYEFLRNSKKRRVMFTFNEYISWYLKNKEYLYVVNDTLGYSFTVKYCPVFKPFMGIILVSCTKTLS